jgi:adenylate cyclase
VPGIEIQAQVIEAIFDGRFLRRPVWLKWAESAFILVFGLLLIWYVPRNDSRLAVFVRTVPKASAILGIALNALSLLSCLLLFRYFGLLVDAASIFIILSAVMGSFFSVLLIDNETQAAQGVHPPRLRDAWSLLRGGKPPRVALALRRLFRRDSK